MSFRTLTLSSWVGVVLNAGCQAGHADPRETGDITFAVSTSGSDACTAAPIEVDVRGLDHPLRRRVALQPSAEQRVSLPPGVYAVAAQVVAKFNPGPVGRPQPDALERRVVLVAPGRASSVRIQVTPEVLPASCASGPSSDAALIATALAVR